MFTTILGHRPATTLSLYHTDLLNNTSTVCFKYNHSFLSDEIATSQELKDRCATEENTYLVPVLYRQNKKTILLYYISYNFLYCCNILWDVLLVMVLWSSSLFVKYHALTWLGCGESQPSCKSNSMGLAYYLAANKLPTINYQSNSNLSAYFLTSKFGLW